MLIYTYNQQCPHIYNIQNNMHLICVQRQVIDQYNLPKVSHISTFKIIYIILISNFYQLKKLNIHIYYLHLK